MPEILPLCILLSCVAIALAIVDCYRHSKTNHRTEKEIPSVERLSDFVLFAPFLALFYTGQFWASLICTLPIILSSYLTQLICYKKGWQEGSFDVIALAPGSYLLATVGYFIFFHQGLLAEPSVVAAAETPESARSRLRFWPYAAYLVCFLFAISRKSSNGIGLSVLLLVLAITILPFFTEHYWLSMATGFGLLLIAVHRAFNFLEPGSSGALSFMSGYLYMIMAFGSIIIYAILY